MKRINLKYITLLLATAMIGITGCSTGSRYTRSTGQYIDDKALAGRVKSELHKDSLVKAANIDVSTFRGTVQLTGFVDHQIQKERASEITRTVDGVQWFKNDLIVKEQLPSAKSTGTEMREPSGAERSKKSMTEGQWEKGSSKDFDSREEQQKEKK